MGDTLELPVSVTDGFSAPLKKLIAQLQGVKPPEGLKQTATHFEALRTHVTQASSSIGRDFSTAMSGLGVTSLGAVASIAAVSSAVKRFSEGTIELRQFERATGVATETLRRFQKAAPEFGVAGDAVQSSLRTFASKFQGQFKRGLGLSDLYSAGEGELAGKIRNSTTIEEALRAGLDAAAENAKRGDPQRGQRILDALGLSGLHNFTVRGKGALDEVFNRKFSPLTTDDEKRAIEFERAVIKINDAFDKVSKTIAIGMTGPDHQHHEPIQRLGRKRWPGEDGRRLQKCRPIRGTGGDRDRHRQAGRRRYFEKSLR